MLNLYAINLIEMGQIIFERIISWMKYQVLNHILNTVD